MSVTEDGGHDVSSLAKAPAMSQFALCQLETVSSKLLLFWQVYIEYELVYKKRRRR